jgi:nitroreductase
LISIITVGYPDENPQPDKKELDEVIHWESF